jgi:hypothetical protein
MVNKRKWENSLARKEIIMDIRKHSEQNKKENIIFIRIYRIQLKQNTEGNL